MSDATDVTVSFTTVEGSFTHREREEDGNRKTYRPCLAVELSGLTEAQFEKVQDILSDVEPVKTGHSDFAGFGSMMKQWAKGTGAEIAGDDAERPPSVSFVRVDDAKIFLNKLKDEGIIDYNARVQLDLDLAATTYLGSLHPEHPR